MEFGLVFVPLSTLNDIKLQQLHPAGLNLVLRGNSDMNSSHQTNMSPGANSGCLTILVYFSLS